MKGGADPPIAREVVPLRRRCRMPAIGPAVRVGMIFYASMVSIKSA